jgi:hypothetical protein
MHHRLHARFEFANALLAFFFARKDEASDRDISARGSTYSYCRTVVNHVRQPAMLAILDRAPLIVRLLCEHSLHEFFCLLVETSAYWSQYPGLETA